MINWIIEFSGRNKYIVILLVAVAVGAGWWSMMNVPLDAIPDLSDTQVIIYSRWDRSPDIVEDQVTYPIVTAMLGAQSAQTTVTLAARDVRRPATVVGSLVRTTFSPSDVWVHPNGKVAYLGTDLGGDRVYVLNVADPSKPAIVDSVIVNARGINDVMTSEDGKFMVRTR